ncbi:succinate dehydrogenase cytochrome b subunit [Geothrix sp. PMB-07]|uniref:succinate dehydrogenase cytochrome b subunit n=1 Tax=Geothrix sp. PMB-07 TaxID=3068640 RepID=UPI002740A098|nr:succinate dehydrogenase cytochrome b subunit [Geothrix sp. PMB-07]WLT30044.1 succinate dehydrogenase cytochrome b subunit [Geothrix sp. PMB-07]
MSVAEQSIAGAEARGHGFLASSVGRKVVMAATGIILFGFVTVHMIGNTQAYLGAESFNAYAKFLHTMLHGAGIWIFRAVLLTAAGLHVWAAVTLTLDNQAARPVGYRAQQSQASTWASRTMRWSGVILAAFIVYHLLHLTTGTVHPNFDHANPYANFVNGFKVPVVAGFYIVAQLCLGLHMWHGVWSVTQSLGLAHPRYNSLRRNFATGLTILVVGVNITYPIAVLTGVIH